jgi:hypothetical protein
LRGEVQLTFPHASHLITFKPDATFPLHQLILFERHLQTVLNGLRQLDSSKGIIVAQKELWEIVDAMDHAISVLLLRPGDWQEQTMLNSSVLEGLPSEVAVRLFLENAHLVLHVAGSDGMELSVETVAPSLAAAYLLAARTRDQLLALTKNFDSLARR